MTAQSGRPAKPSPDPATVAVYVDHTAALPGLTLDPAWRPGVVAHLIVILRAAAMVDAFPLPEEVEPAPAFRP